MVFGKFISGVEDLAVVKEIRKQVFEEELGLEVERAVPDEFCMHALAYDKEKPVGMGRIMFDGDRFTIAGIAVLPEYRGQLYGDFLIRLLIDKAMMSNAQEIYLEALAGTEDFFAITGFEVCGDTYEKLGGRWTPMVLHTDQIHKCCGCAK
jgi:predicted GNAT family N-acyltransferase